MVGIRDVIDVQVNVVTEEAHEDLGDLSAHADKVYKELMRKRREAMAALQKTITVYSTAFNLFKKAYKALGGTLNPFGEAMSSLIQTTITAYTQVAALMASSVVGIPAAALLVAGIISFSIVTEMMKAAGLEDMATKMSEIDDAVESALSFINALKR
jgi:hypothetical protein